MKENFVRKSHHYSSVLKQSVLWIAISKSPFPLPEKGQTLKISKLNQSLKKLANKAIYQQIAKNGCAYKSIFLLPSIRNTHNRDNK